MGLEERRRIKELEEVTLPARSEEIREICGVAIRYEVDWTSLSNDAEGLNFLDNVSCHRLNMALRVICVDDLGRSAVREGLRLIKLRNVADQNNKAIQFTGGVLEMQCAYRMRMDGAFDDNEIRKVLLEQL